MGEMANQGDSEAGLGPGLKTDRIKAPGKAIRGWARVSYPPLLALIEKRAQ